MNFQDVLQNAGIIGAGGAGFPSYAKQSPEADTLVINGAECEPLLYTDYFLLKNHLDGIISGAQTLMDNSAVKETVLGIESHKARLLSLSDGQRLLPHLTVKCLPDAYPMGDEISLIWQTVGRLVPPGKLPITQKVIVQNAETVLNIGCALLSGQPVVDKNITVAGDIGQAFTLCVPVGTPVSEVLAALGVTVSEKQILLDGGPAMGKRINPDTAVVKKTTKGLTVLPLNSEAARRVLRDTSSVFRIAATACCQCTRCTDLCPRALLGYPLEPHRMVRALIRGGEIASSLLSSAQLCCGCGICETVACCQGISPKSIIDRYKGLLRESGTRYIDNASEPRIPSPLRPYRQIPAQHFAALLGVERFDCVPSYIKELFVPSQVQIPLIGHIGKPSVCCVSVGERIKRGQLIANAAAGLGIPQHASICGTVVAVSDKQVVIKREGI